MAAIDHRGGDPGPFVGKAGSIRDFSHELLESDRVITLQLGRRSRMTLQMPGGGMLSRSTSDELPASTEEYTRPYDKMAGLGG